MKKFNEVTSSSSTPTPATYAYGGDFGLALNLGELIEAVGVGVTHNIVTRVPTHLAEKFMTFRTISLWAKRMLTPGGLLVLVGTVGTLPIDTRALMRELKYVGGAKISTDEVALVFRKPDQSWLSKFANALIPRILNTSSQFKDYNHLIAYLVRRHEIVLDPFKNELNIGQAVTDIGFGRTYIGADAAAKSIEDLVASIEVRS